MSRAADVSMLPRDDANPDICFGSGGVARGAGGSGGGILPSAGGANVSIGGVCGTSVGGMLNVAGGTNALKKSLAEANR